MEIKDRRSKITHSIFHARESFRKMFLDTIDFGELTEREAKFFYHIRNGINTSTLLQKHFKCHKSTVTQKTSSLKEKAYLDEDISSKDKREKKFILTKKGKDFYKKIDLRFAELEAEIFKNFSKKEEEKLLELLLKLELGNRDHEIC